MTVSVCGMSGEVEENKDVFKQGMNFIHQDEKAHDEQCMELLQEVPQL